MDEVPIIYAYIFCKIKENNRTCFIDIPNLKEIIERSILLRGGVPNYLRKEIIKELINLRLIEKMNHSNNSNYRILNNKNCEKKIQKLKIIEALP